MSKRTIKNVKLIESNPGMTGNELYKEAKRQGFGIKKTDFYSILRTIRKLPEPTLKEKEKFTPIKYRKPLKPISIINDLPIPKKDGAYGIVEIEADDDKSFWIKYENKKSLNKQFDTLKRRYKIKVNKIIFYGFGKYEEFITKEFKELLESAGINI